MGWVVPVIIAGLLATTPASHAEEIDPATATPTPEVTEPTTAATSPPTASPPTSGGPVIPSPEPGEDIPDPNAPQGATRVLIFGDSISAQWRYSADGAGSRFKAWWAYVAERSGLRASAVMLSAESGSGLLARGMDDGRRVCRGTTFGSRLDQIAVTDPDVIIVEVGRNDIYRCVGSQRRLSTGPERRAAARTYFQALAEAADAAGVARRNVYVMSPWGSSAEAGRVAVTALYESQAATWGFGWIPLPALRSTATSDAIHPNAAGTRLIADWVLAGSDLSAAIRRPADPRSPAASGTSVRCTGWRACRAAGVSNQSYGTATRPIWAVRARTARHYVAYRLTRGRTSAPVMTATTARDWKDAVLRDRAAAWTSQARPGDIAWWPEAPASVKARAGEGHVAYVEAVAADNSAVRVTEVDGVGQFRSVRYSGASLPRAYLRFGRPGGSPRGIVTSVSARTGSVSVTGRVADPDAFRRGARLRVTVKQGGRTWTVTTKKPATFAFARTFRFPRLRAGRAVVKVTALNAPRSRGTSVRLATRTVRVP